MDIYTNKVKEVIGALKKASVLSEELLIIVEENAETMQSDYLARRCIGSTLMEDFVPLPIFRDFLNNVYGTTNSSRRYASMLKARGFRQSAKRIGSTTYVGFLFKFMDPEDRGKFEKFTSEYLNK